MRWAHLVDQFDERAGRCTSAAELAALLEAAVRELGFDHFALLHHASLGRRGAGLIRLDNYPSAWAVELASGGLAADDLERQHIAFCPCNAGAIHRRGHSKGESHPL